MRPIRVASSKRSREQPSWDRFGTPRQRSPRQMHHKPHDLHGRDSSVGCTSEPPLSLRLATGGTPGSQPHTHTNTRAKHSLKLNIFITHHHSFSFYQFCFLNRSKKTVRNLLLKRESESHGAEVLHRARAQSVLVAEDIATSAAPVQHFHPRKR